MERNEAIEFAVKNLGMEVSKAKKMGTAQLIKKVSGWVASQPKVAVLKRRGRPANPNKTPKVSVVKHGEYMLGWNTPDGNVRVLKYCTIKRQGNDCQTIIDSALEPKKMSRVHVYKKESTAALQRDLMIKSDPERYAGLEVLVK